MEMNILLLKYQNTPNSSSDDRAYCGEKYTLILTVIRIPVSKLWQLHTMNHIMHVVIFDDGCGHITTIAKHFDKKARYRKDAVGKIHQIITGHVLTFDS